MSTPNISVFIIPVIEHVIVTSAKLLLKEGQIQLREYQAEARACVGREWQQGKRRSSNHLEFDVSQVFKVFILHNCDSQ